MVASYGSNGLMLNSVNATADVRQGRRKRVARKKKKKKKKEEYERGLPQRLSGEEFACSTGDTCWIPGSGRSLGGGNGNPLQYSCLKNLMDRRAWWVAKSWTRLVTERTLSEKEKRKKKDKRQL